jgi:hypothetical protein
VGFFLLRESATLEPGWSAAAASDKELASQPVRVWLILGNMESFFERIDSNYFLVVVLSNRVGEICNAYMHGPGGSGLITFLIIKSSALE